MAFNLLTANQAAGTNFKKTTEGFVSLNNYETIISSNESRTENSLKIIMDGRADGPVTWPPRPIQENTDHSILIQYNLPSSYPIILGALDGSSWNWLGAKLFTCEPGWQETRFSFNSGDSTSIFLHFRIDEAVVETYFLGNMMLNEGSPKDWEFPGIDLTGNSIPANTQINNVKLENIIRAFGIESTEQVNNLTLQNILTLTNIPSEEYVNNIELLNEIIMEGIESTTSIHDLLLYIIFEVRRYSCVLSTNREYNGILSINKEYEAIL